ncbi:MAG TPA: IS21-like element helper ATPase IstB [Lacipirellulaceae bacterium]|nr:IS21-like element helper ATPase IstB [Lacipirellulaceae bacterium]
MTQLQTTLRQLRLSGLMQTLDVRLQEAAAARLGHGEFLELIFQDELNVRHQRMLARRTKAADFRALKSLEDFDWQFNPSINRKQIFELATGNYLREGKDILFLGPPGVGKTHLAIALGVKAVEAGYSVLFLTLETLMTRLAKAVHENRLERSLQQLSYPKLLIIDEVGYLPLVRSEATLFFRLVVRRYERASMIITSNKSFLDWGDMFNDPVLATAVLDRLLHYSTTLNIKGESYRLKEKRRAGLLGRPTSAGGAEQERAGDLSAQVQPTAAA